MECTLGFPLNSNFYSLLYVTRILSFFIICTSACIIGIKASPGHGSRNTCARVTSRSYAASYLAFVRFRKVITRVRSRILKNVVGICTGFDYGIEEVD